MKTNLGRILSEPILKFLAIGGCLFLAYGMMNWSEEKPLADNIIEITPSGIERLTAGFEKTWRRPPDKNELSNMVDSYVRAEVLVREALNLGLDRGDAVIRGRMVQKMEFLLSSASNSMVATESDLSAFLIENPERFQIPGRIAFDQVYIGELPDENSVIEVRKKLADGVEFDQLSVQNLLPASVPLLQGKSVDAQFGSGFASAASKLPIGSWSGPVQSGFGQHFVRVVQREDPMIPALEEIRDEVEREWRQEVSTELSQLQYELMVQRFEIRRGDTAE